MGIEPKVRWFVVHTHAHSEAKAAFHLLRQGFEIYLPHQLKIRRHARRVERVLAPLFPRYLFVRVDLSCQRWHAIRSTLGVSRLVCNGDAPAPAPDSVVQAIKQREADGIVRLAPQSQLSPGMAVRVREGLLTACMGLVEACTDTERVVILLDILGRKVRVNVAGAAIEAA